MDIEIKPCKRNDLSTVVEMTIVDDYGDSIQLNCLTADGAMALAKTLGVAIERHTSHCVEMPK